MTHVLITGSTRGIGCVYCCTICGQLAPLAQKSNTALKSGQWLVASGQWGQRFVELD